MKRFLIAAAVAVVTITGFNTTALAEVGVSVNMGQANFYGPLDLNGYPQPQVIYPQPTAIGQVPINQPPVYMRVPSDHAKNWSNYCKQYNACAERVLFVQDSWYNREYAPRYQKQHGNSGNNKNNREYVPHYQEQHGNRGNNKNNHAYAPHYQKQHGNRGKNKHNKHNKHNKNRGHKHNH